MRMKWSRRTSSRSDYCLSVNPRMGFERFSFASGKQSRGEQKHPGEKNIISLTLGDKYSSRVRKSVPKQRANLIWHFAIYCKFIFFKKKKKKEAIILRELKIWISSPVVQSKQLLLLLRLKYQESVSAIKMKEGTARNSWSFLSCQEIFFLCGRHLFFIFLLLNHSSKPLARFKFIQCQLVYGVSEVDLDLSDKITGQNYNHGGKDWFVFGLAYHNWKITRQCP